MRAATQKKHRNFTDVAIFLTDIKYSYRLPAVTLRAPWESQNRLNSPNLSNVALLLQSAKQVIVPGWLQQIRTTSWSPNPHHRVVGRTAPETSATHIQSPVGGFLGR